MLAIDIARFADPAAFGAQVAALLAEARAEEPADAGRAPLAPGDPERLCAAARRKAGVPLPAGVLGELKALGAELGVELA